MRIVSSDIVLASERFYAQNEETHESLRAWVGERRPDFEGHGRRLGNIDRPARVSISDEGLRKSKAAEKVQAASENGTQINDVRLLVLKSLIERLTGRKIEVIDPDDLTAPVDDSELSEHAEKPAAPARAGYGVEYDYYARRVEVEKTSFSAEGVIRTADGREI